MYIKGKSVYAISCGGKLGDTIIIQHNTEFILCEVEIYGKLRTEKGSAEKGSASVDIANKDKFASTQKKKNGVKIICNVALTNVKLEKAGDPNNVNWYKVNKKTGEETKIKENSLIKINKSKGTYRLWFKKPQPEDSGTYKCEFNQQGVKASAEVSVVWA